VSESTRIYLEYMISVKRNWHYAENNNIKCTGCVYFKKVEVIIEYKSDHNNPDNKGYRIHK